MIKWLHKDDIDELAWNRCVKNSNLDLPYALTWYLDVVTENYGGLILNDYEAVMPLPFRSKMGVKYIFQPFFIQQLGIYSSKDISLETESDFIEAIPGTFKYVDAYFNEEHPINEKSGFTIRHTSHLNLKRDYETIAKGYNSNTKRNIKKAILNTIEYVNSADELIDIFSSQKSQSETGLSEKDYDTLRALVSESIQRKKGKVAVLKQEDEITAGVFFLKTEKKLIWLFPVLNQKFKSHNPLFSLTDQIIKSYAGQDLTLDFEGSMIPSVQRIYDGFGAHKKSYPHYKLNRLPRYLKWMKR